MHVLTLDPGKMSGRAVWIGYKRPQVQKMMREEPYFHADMLPYDKALNETMNTILHGGYETPDHVIMEDFIITERTAKMSTEGWRRGAELEFIGAVRWGCYEQGVDFVLQTPQEAKGFSTDAKLKRMGWWTKGKDHPRDATRHLLLWLTKNGLIDPTVLVGDA